MSLVSIEVPNNMYPYHTMTCISLSIGCQLTRAISYAYQNQLYQHLTVTFVPYRTVWYGGGMVPPPYQSTPHHLHWLWPWFGWGERTTEI